MNTPSSLDVYLHRLRAGIGAMTTALGGIDALVFTGGRGRTRTRHQSGGGRGPAPPRPPPGPRAQPRRRRRHRPQRSAHRPAGARDPRVRGPRDRPPSTSVTLEPRPEPLGEPPPWRGANEPPTTRISAPDSRPIGRSSDRMRRPHSDQARPSLVRRRRSLIGANSSRGAVAAAGRSDRRVIPAVGIMETLSARPTQRGHRGPRKRLDPSGFGASPRTKRGGPSRGEPHGARCFVQ